jgi:hypothetical protein
MTDQVVVSETALGYLQATRPWVKFLAIVGFVFIVLMWIIGLWMCFASSALQAQPGMPRLFGPVLGVVYILLSFVYVMPCLFLYRYSKAIAAIPAAGESALEDALKNQKSLWKFMGILMIVVLCFYALCFVIAILFGLAAVLMAHH